MEAFPALTAEQQRRFHEFGAECARANGVLSVTTLCSGTDGVLAVFKDRGAPLCECVCGSCFTGPLTRLNI